MFSDISRLSANFSLGAGTGRSASCAERPESRNPGFLSIGKCAADRDGVPAAARALARRRRRAPPSRSSSAGSGGRAGATRRRCAAPPPSCGVSSATTPATHDPSSASAASATACPSRSGPEGSLGRNSRLPTGDRGRLSCALYNRTRLDAWLEALARGSPRRSRACPAPLHRRRRRRRAANSASPHDFRSMAARTIARPQPARARPPHRSPSLSASAVVVARRLAAHASRSGLRYRTRLPKRWKAGPSPLTR